MAKAASFSKAEKEARVAQCYRVRPLLTDHIKRVEELHETDLHSIDRALPPNHPPIESAQNQMTRA